ncbi:hypothetical protein JCM19274_4244 [Algibacter lectus]|uniref:Uncharacterized protein n=1 Tax=Algibacter lectus TaxID=221126 RepID=A0A090WUU2_9FLAO|nr:hypothetical protein JCM19274_4244 [Algibacter lectus]
MILETLKPQVSAIISNQDLDKNERLLKICELLDKNITYYNWVGSILETAKKKSYFWVLMLVRQQTIL